VVGAINNANLSNSAKAKLVKVLNNLGVVHIIASTSQTPTLESTNCPMHFFNSLALNMLDESVATTTTVNTHYLYLSMFANISFIPLSLEDEKLKLFDLEILELSPIKL
jgi:hypothetical protein